MESTLVQVFIGIVVLIASILIWHYLFWQPFDWYRDLTDLGFDDVNRSKKYDNDISKKNQINELRQRRKHGELPPVYPNGWFVILESDELPQNGVKEVCVLGLNLVAWRGNTGKSYVADAYCPHLGAHLAVGGKVSGECIACPFHGWKFRGSDGVLANIPYSDSNSNSFLESKLAKINIRTTKELNGFIFLWFHAEGHEPTWVPELIPEIQSKEWKYRGRSELHVACHIQEVPENGADTSHLNIVHGSVMITDYSWFEWNFIKQVMTAEWKASEKPGEKHVANLNLKAHVCLFNKYNVMPMKIEIRQIGPGYVVLMVETTFGRGIFFHTVTPIAPLVQKIVHRFYSAKSFIHPIGKLALLTEAIMIERDIRIWNRKTYIKNPLLTKEDKSIQSFRRWFSQFYSPNSPKYYFSNNENSNSFEF